MKAIQSGSTPTWIVSSPPRRRRLVWRRCFIGIEPRIGAEVVRITGYYFVFAARNADGTPCFLDLHLAAAYQLDDQHFYSGCEILESRCRHKQFWIPAAKIEFCSYLIKKNPQGASGCGTRTKTQQLVSAGSGRLPTADCLASGAPPACVDRFQCSSGRWGVVAAHLNKLRVELCRRAAMRHPWRTVGNRYARVMGRVQKFCKPESGLDVILLGPDGGKINRHPDGETTNGGCFHPNGFPQFPA